jgi:hypothetical protein
VLDDCIVHHLKKLLRGILGPLPVPPNPRRCVKMKSQQGRVGPFPRPFQVAPTHANTGVCQSCPPPGVQDVGISPVLQERQQPGKMVWSGQPPPPMHRM